MYCYFLPSSQLVATRDTALGKTAETTTTEVVRATTDAPQDRDIEEPVADSHYISGSIICQLYTEY